jgi:hypothetical protein
MDRREFKKIEHILCRVALTHVAVGAEHCSAPILHKGEGPI